MSYQASRVAAAELPYWNGKQGSRPSLSSSYNANPAQPRLSENHNLTVTQLIIKIKGKHFKPLRELYAKPLSERHVNLMALFSTQRKSPSPIQPEGVAVPSW